MRRLFFVLVVALVALPSAAEAFPGANGKISFVRPGGCLYLANPDGSGESLVGSCDSSYLGPAGTLWTADGKWIGFSNQLVTVGEVKPDGSGYSPYNDDTGGNSGWALSPAAPTPAAGPVAVTWSYFENMGQPYQAGIDIFTAGASHHILLDDSAEFTTPDWSPDGRLIAFSHNSTNLEVIQPDGQARDTIVSGASPSEFNFGPAWSPDGSRIAFMSNRDGNYEIYVVDADGTGVTRLTQNSFDDFGPRWSPDGSKILFGSTRSGENRIYTMNADGSGEAFVTLGQGADWQPVQVPYVRPKGATPDYLSLVPAYTACTTPNRTHQAPLSYGSCYPPSQSSASSPSAPPTPTPRAPSRPAS